MFFGGAYSLYIDNTPEYSMLNLNEDTLTAAIVERATDEFLSEDRDISGLVAKEIKSRLDKIFAERANAQIVAAIDAAVAAGFSHEFQRVNSWGEPEGQKTTIRDELQKTVESYWSHLVDKYGKPVRDSYGSITRAEFLMTQICAEGFSKQMKEAAVTVTSTLKDGLRAQLAAHTNHMLNELFHVKSLQDQGKAPMPS